MACFASPHCGPQMRSRGILVSLDRLRAVARLFPGLHYLLSPLLALGALGALGVALHEHDGHVVERALLSQRIAQQVVKTHTAESLYATAKQSVIVKSETVTKVLTKTRTLWDTIQVVPLTAEDTAIAISQLPELKRESLAALNSCADLQLSVNRYMSACDSMQHALREERDTYRQAWESEHPSGVRKAWDRIKVPLALGVGLYVGARVTR